MESSISRSATWSDSPPPVGNWRTQSFDEDDSLFGLEEATEAVASLASSFFAQVSRNRRVLVAWASQPLPPPRDEEELSSSGGSFGNNATIWERREAQRLARRRRSRLSHMHRTTIKDVMRSRKLLQTAATAAVGRRSMRASAALNATVHAMRNEHSAILVGTVRETESPVDDLAEILSALLLQPIRFTVVADSRNLAVYPFGRERCDQFCIPGSCLMPDELQTLSFLGMCAQNWARCEEMSAGSELLRARADVNEAFDLALDRVALVMAFCDALTDAIHPDKFTACKSTLEAALNRVTSREEVRECGYADPIARCISNLRLKREPGMGERRTPSPVDRAHAMDFVMRNQVRIIRKDEYLRWLKNDPPSIRSSPP